MFLFKYLIVTCSLIFCSNIVAAVIVRKRSDSTEENPPTDYQQLYDQIVGGNQSNSTAVRNNDDEFVPLEAETEKPILLRENKPSNPNRNQFSSNREVFNENSKTSVQTKNSDDDYSQQGSGSLNFPRNYNYPRGSFSNDRAYYNPNDQYRGGSSESFRSSLDMHRARVENARNSALAAQASQFARRSTFPNPNYPDSDYTMAPLNSFPPSHQSSNFGGFSNPIPNFDAPSFGRFPEDSGFSSSQHSVHYQSESGPGFQRTAVFGSNNGMPFGAVF